MSRIVNIIIIITMSITILTVNGVMTFRYMTLFGFSNYYSYHHYYYNHYYYIVMMTTFQQSRLCWVLQLSHVSEVNGERKRLLGKYGSEV